MFHSSFCHYVRIFIHTDINRCKYTGEARWQREWSFHPINCNIILKFLWNCFFFIKIFMDKLKKYFCKNIKWNSHVTVFALDTFSQFTRIILDLFFIHEKYIILFFIIRKSGTRKILSSPTNDTSLTKNNYHGTGMLVEHRNACNLICDSSNQCFILVQDTNNGVQNIMEPFATYVSPTPSY